MENRVGNWECQKCGHSEPATAESKSARRLKAIQSSRDESTASSSAAWKQEHGTHMLDFSKGSGRPKSSQSGPPPPHQPEYQNIQEFTKREQKKTKYYVDSGEDFADNRDAEQRLAVEKMIYFGLWLLLSAYVCYLIVTSIYYQDPFNMGLEMHEIIYIAVLAVAVMIGVMWYTLYCESPELKWISVIVGCFVALGQAIFAFVLFTDDIFIGNLTFDTGYSGIFGLVVAAALTVAWTCWYVYILYRDIKTLQV